MYGLGIFRDEPGVTRARFVGIDNPRVSPGIEIEHQPDLFRPGMLLYECLRSQKPNLFAIGIEKNHIILESRSSLERPCGL
jgi:hypothetical protein